MPITRLLRAGDIPPDLACVDSDIDLITARHRLNDAVAILRDLAKPPEVELRTDRAGRRRIL